MSDLSSQLKEKTNFNESAKDAVPTLSHDLRAEKTKDNRKKISGLGSIRMSAPAKKIISDEAKAENEMLGIRTEESISAKSGVNLGVSIFLISAIIWVAYGFGFYLQQGFSYTPEAMSSLFLTLFAPPALLWYVVKQFMGGGSATMSGSGAREFDGDVEAFYQQAQDISSMCRAVLKSLQRARQGLRVEMRDFSGVSKKAEFHIDRLAEALKQKNESLVDLVDELDGKVELIDQKVAKSSDAWAGAIDVISERSLDVEKSLMEGASKIVSAADDAADKTAGIQEGMRETFDDLTGMVDDMYERVDGVNQRFEGHSDSLSEIVEHVAQETERLTDTIKTQVSELEGTAGRTFASVIESASAITTSKEQMEIGVKELYEQSELVSAVVKDSVSKLHESVDYVSKNSSELEERLDERTKSLKSSVDGIAKQAHMIEEVGDQASNKLAESLSVAVGGAESISFAIRRAVDSLEDGGAKAQNRADKIVNDVTEQLERINESASENTQRLDDVASMLNRSGESFAEVSDKTSTQITALVDTLGEQNTRLEKGLTDLSGCVGSVGGALTQSLREVQNAVNEADSRHNMIESVISRRVEDLSQASDKAVKAVEDIRSTMRGQVQEMSTLSAQLTGQGKTLGDQILVQKEQLDSSVKASLEGLQKVSHELGSQVSEVRFSCEGASKDISDVTEILASRYEALKGVSNEAERDLESLDQVLITKLSALYEQNDQIKKSFGELTGEIETSAGSIIPACATAMDKADEVHDRFVQLREECMQISDSNVTRFKQFGVMVESSIEDLKAGSDEAKGVLVSANDLLVQRAQSLRDTSQKAVLDIENASDNLRSQSETIHLLSDKAVVKMDTVQQEINSNFMDFSESVSQASSQLREAGDQFSAESDRVQDEIQAGIDLFKTTGVKAREEVFMLTSATQKFASDAEEIMLDVKLKSNSVLDSADVILSDFKKTGDTILIRSRELSEQMKSSLQTSEMYGREIKGQVSSISGSSIEVAEQIGKAVSMLNSSMDQIGRTAHDTTDTVAIERERLSVEADRLMQVSSAALETTKDAADTFTRQSELMFKSVRDVQEATKSLHQKEEKAERGAFLSSSRFVIESLHSLSVDVSRIMDGGDVSERAWQAFQRGDVSVFTRKLAALGDDWPIEKAREKFKSDAEFRTYVQRFIRQFEEVYDQACAKDHGSLLSVTIGSSDVAKLYASLCKVAMRDSKLVKALADKS